MKDIRITTAQQGDPDTLRARRDELPEGSIERLRIEDHLAELDGPETRPF